MSDISIPLQKPHGEKGRSIVFYPDRRSGLVPENRLGLTHIYYGSGGGKTTRVVGLATRAAGEGLIVDFVQFMKPGGSGEVAVFDRIEEHVHEC